MRSVRLRSGLTGVVPLAMMLASGTASIAWAGPDRAEIGLPTHAFALSWTSLPTGRFSPLASADMAMSVHAAREMPVDEARMHRVLDQAFASAGDARERREIALDEMTTPWPQTQRTAFQTLRDAATAYAGADARRDDRFAAMVSRVVDGTGRSAASDGSAAAALDSAYAAALARDRGGARASTEAAQTAFVAYRDAFVAFADDRSPGTGAGVANELDRQRTADLDADSR